MNAIRWDFNEFAIKRIESFHKKCIEKCKTKKAFDKGFIVDKSHIAKGIIKNPKRSSLTNEDLAAVILGGEIHFTTCNLGPPLEIVIKGLIYDFDWVDLTSKGFPSYREEKVEVKVVIRERKNQGFIVTAYITDNINEITTQREIEREIW